MSNESYQQDILEAADQLFKTGDYAAFQEDMVSIVDYWLSEGYMEGADEVLPPEPEQPPIIQTIQELTPEQEKKLPESAKIALLALLTLNIGYISSFGVFVLNKRNSYDTTVLALNDAVNYLKMNNIPLAIYTLQRAESSAAGIGTNIVGAVSKLITSVQNGGIDISLGVKKATEGIQQTITRNITSKASVWSNGYLNSKNMGMLLSAPDDTHMKWNLGEREHCSSCLKLDGKVKTADYWREAGIGPQAGPSGALPNPYLQCKGYNCGCFFTATDDNLSPGDLPSLP